MSVSICVCLREFERVCASEWSLCVSVCVVLCVYGRVCVWFCVCVCVCVYGRVCVTLMALRVHDGKSRPEYLPLQKREIDRERKYVYVYECLCLCVCVCVCLCVCVCMGVCERESDMLLRQSSWVGVGYCFRCCRASLELIVYDG